MTHKDLILQQCEKRGMKLKDLADKMGILPSTLSETMRRCKPSYDLLERMSQALGCLPGDLLPHTESDNITCPKCGHQFRVEINVKEE